VVISDINYINITGEKCHYPAVLTCQANSPCQNIMMDNVNVATGASVKNMECAYAHGKAVNVEPSSCLLSK